MVDTPGIRRSDTGSPVADAPSPSKADPKPNVAAPSAQSPSSAGANLTDLAAMKPPEAGARPAFSARPSIDGTPGKEPGARPVFSARPTLEGAAQVSGPQPGASMSASEHMSRIAGRMRANVHSGVRQPGLLGLASERASRLSNRFGRPVGLPPGVQPGMHPGGQPGVQPGGAPPGMNPPVAPMQPSPLENAMMMAGNYAPMMSGMVGAGSQLAVAAMQSIQSITMAIAEIIKNGAKNVEKASEP